MGFFFNLYNFVNYEQNYDLQWLRKGSTCPLNLASLVFDSNLIHLGQILCAQHSKPLRNMCQNFHYSGDFFILLLSILFKNILFIYF